MRLARAGEQQADQLAFEREYEHDYSWEQLEEDEAGNLKAPDTQTERRARRLRTLHAAHAARIRRGLIRYLEIVVDLSRAAAATDMRPLRAAVMANALARFIRAFFDENPLSQLGIISMRDGVAHILTSLSSGPVSVDAIVWDVRCSRARPILILFEANPSSAVFRKPILTNSRRVFKHQGMLPSRTPLIWPYMASGGCHHMARERSCFCLQASQVVIQVQGRHLL